MDEQKGKKSKKCKHLTKLANAISFQNETLAKLYISKVDQTNADGNKNIHYCYFCGNPYSPQTCKTRFMSKVKLNARKMYRLVARLQVDDENVGKLQRNLTSMYKRSCTTMVITCLVCGKQRIVKGQSRENSEKQFRTPRQSETAMTLEISKKERLKEKRRKKRQKQKQAVNSSIRNPNRTDESVLSASGDWMTDSGLEFSSEILNSPVIHSTSTPRHAGASLLPSITPKHASGTLKSATSNSTPKHVSVSSVQTADPSTSSTSRLPTPISVRHSLSAGNASTPPVVSLWRKADGNQSPMESPGRRVGKSAKKKKRLNEIHRQLQKVLKDTNREKKSLQDFLSCV